MSSLGSHAHIARRMSALLRESVGLLLVVAACAMPACGKGRLSGRAIDKDADVQPIPDAGAVDDVSVIDAGPILPPRATYHVTAGGGRVSGGGMHGVIVIGAPQPMGTVKDATHHGRLGLVRPLDPARILE